MLTLIAIGFGDAPLSLALYSGTTSHQSIFLHCCAIHAEKVMFQQHTTHYVLKKQSGETP